MYKFIPVISQSPSFSSTHTKFDVERSNTDIMTGSICLSCRSTDIHFEDFAKVIAKRGLLKVTHDTRVRKCYRLISKLIKNFGRTYTDGARGKYNTLFISSSFLFDGWRRPNRLLSLLYILDNLDFCIKQEKNKEIKQFLLAFQDFFQRRTLRFAYNKEKMTIHYALKHIYNKKRKDCAGALLNAGDTVYYYNDSDITYLNRVPEIKKTTVSGFRFQPRAFNQRTVMLVGLSKVQFNYDIQYFKSYCTARASFLKRIEFVKARYEKLNEQYMRYLDEAANNCWDLGCEKVKQKSKKPNE